MGVLKIYIGIYRHDTDFGRMFKSLRMSSARSEEEGKHGDTHIKDKKKNR